MISLEATGHPQQDAPDRESGHEGAMRLVQAVQALSLARDLESIISIVRKEARALVRADGATFVLRDGDKCYYADEDAIAPLWKGQRFPLSACISGWAMANRRPAIIKDIYADDRIPFDAYRPTFVKSLVMVPIRTENPIGAIGIYWADRRQASDYEVELLQALANCTSVAMENVDLYAELERRVVDRTRQLEDVNRELETFSYSVSHDLQAPLRHIGAYSSLLMTDHAGSLDDEARNYLARIQTSTNHLSALIQDLLRLARFTRVELNLQPVDLSGMAHELADHLREEGTSRAVEFHIHEGLGAQGDAGLLRIALENLLGNAWKFTGKRELARIEFGSLSRPDGTSSYFVKDNGAGFDMRYAHKLFNPFQRLHGVKDFGGSGIGLATVKRIVHRHGGSVWAESSLDSGATFSFTLGNIA